ncbi:MAG: DGQHR domain-containing protein [Oscillatoriales cyanobacterium RM2_1_1]|nr:DGQHR domain-containing protein [Oscillatoriales cyanobacterium SM2_3_0]NJO44455.1 DGQHR domain-containing protein [Oscillatoriales cyanobacterium RM2_1_1]
METKKSYFGCRVFQRESSETVAFFVFYARTRDIKQWVGIRRVEDHSDGTQRLLRSTRKKAITNFLKSDPVNTIPNNILLAFEPGTVKFTSLQERLEEFFPDQDLRNDCEDRLNWGCIEFSYKNDLPEHRRPALVVDGQHRLYGISEFADENIPLLVVSLIDAPLSEQAFQFVVINNKAVKVPTDNVRSIIAQIDEEKLQDRLLKAGVRYGNKSPILREINDSLSSPFKDLLDWSYNKKGTKLVPLTAIEQCLRFLKAELPSLEDDEDSLAEVFCAVWRVIQKSYPELWGKESKLMKKVSINALNEFIAERLKFAWEMGLVNIFDPHTIERQVLNITNLLPQQFWEEEWSITIQDNANVRKLIKADLATLANNSRTKEPWMKDLDLPKVSNSVEF